MAISLKRQVRHNILFTANTDHRNLGRLNVSMAHDAMYDPFNIDSVVQLVGKAQASASMPMAQRPIFVQKRESRISISDAHPESHLRSPLRLLSAEILDMVFEQLTISDLLSLWLASSKVPDYFPPRFWRSRFKYGMEFGHLFEAKALWHMPNVDWYALFWKVRDLLSSSAGFHIRNRRRALFVIDRVVDLVSLYTNRSLEGTEGHPANAILLETDGLSAHQRLITLPQLAQIEAIHISTVQLNGRWYISGLRVNDGASGLGYYHECTSTTLNVDVAIHGCVCQIGCYMDRYGVRGLYLITESGWTTGISLEAEAAKSLSQGVLPIGEELNGHFDVYSPRPPFSNL
jgi:hypothetical protein